MDRRNALIAVLAAAVLVLVGFLALERGWLSLRPTVADDQQPVRAVEVALDREARRHLDVFFDRPLGRKRVGETPAEAPATIQPRIGGEWRWQGENILRFAATDRFQPATRYEIELLPERLLGEKQVWVGDLEFHVVTDAFQVDRADVHEEILPDKAGVVRLRGTLHFNYAVNPRELAPRLELRDPEGPNASLSVALETNWSANSIGFRIDEVRKTKAERTLELVISGDLTPAKGNVELAGAFVYPIPLGSRDRLSVRGVTAQPGEQESTLRVELSAPVEPEAVRPSVRVEPDVEFTLSRDRNALLLRGPFEPGGSYGLQIAAGVRGVDGSVLGEDFDQRVQLASLSPEVDFQSRGMFLSAQGMRAVALESVNVPRVELVVERVYRNNVLHLVESASGLLWRDEPGYGGLARVYGDRIAEEVLELEGPRNRTLVTPIALDPYLRDAEPGLYRVVAGPVGRPYQRRQRWVLITDLGLVAKTSGEDVLVWVSSFADLSPVADATVRLISVQNQLLAEGRSDSEGLVHLRALGEALEGEQIGLVEVERGADWSFLPTRQTTIDATGFDVGGSRAPAAGYDAYLYGERDLYRPGEVLRGVAVLRDRELRAPPSMPVVLRHRDPEGRERGDLRVETDDAGLASFELELPRYERTGIHRLEARVGDSAVGQYRFHVEEFIPDRIKVEIDPPEDEPGPGELLRFAVEGAYLFGPPAAGLPVDARVRLEAAPFSVQGFEGFSFRDPDRKFKRHEILAVQSELDPDGRGSFEVQVPSALRVPDSLVAVITARVQEQGGRGVTGRLRVPVHPYPYYVGLRRGAEGYAEPGSTESFEYVAVAPGGSQVASGPLRAEIFLDRWHTVLRRTSGGTFRYETKRDPELVGTVAIPAGEARGRFEFSIAEYGSYRVVLSDPTTGASTQARFYASGWGYVPWALEDPGKIELDLDRDEYAPGDTAQVQVRAPFPGRLLLTVEGDRIFHVGVHELEGNTAKLAVPVQSDWRPNVYVTATLVRAASALEAGAVGRAFGAAPLVVDRETHRLPVALEVPEEMRPRGSLQVGVRAQPGARVTVAAVDEGILQLIAQPTPAPFDHFYRKRALGVRTHDIFSLLLPEVALETATPGGGEEVRKQGEFVRTEGIRRVEPVALWSGIVTANADGAASVSFDVPEFQGALRVMAVAVRGNDFGSSDASVRVRDPVVLLPTFPRFLSFGETLLLPVTLRNDTGSAGEFRVALVVSGPISVSGESELRATVENAREHTFYFELATATGSDPIALALSAAGNGETSRSSVELGTLRSDLPPVTHELSGTMQEPQLALALEAEAGLRPEGRRRTLRISRYPLVAYSGRLSSLLRYPYGCLEQVTSSAFPLLYLGTLASELEPELFETVDPESRVAEAVRRVQSLQLSDGGFGLWQRAKTADLWASLYATHFLVEAERAGHGVARPGLDRALDFTAGAARPRGQSSAALQRAAYAQYVLARAGRPDVASMDFLREKQLERMNASSRALVAAAYAGIGHADGIETLLAGIERDEQIRRQTGGNYGSPLRDRALVLLALLEAAPEDPRIQELARRIARDAAAPGAWTTQETAFALLALGELFQRQAERPVYSGRVEVAGREVARFDAQTRVIDALPDGPIALVMDPDYAPGSAYYSFAVRGVPTDEAFAPSSHGLEIERTLSRRGAGAVEDHVEQGDLIRLRFRIRATESSLQNVVIQQLLPAGLEVENPRLATTEADRIEAAHIDVRDDRILVFLDLRDRKWHSYQALLRAVSPGRFRLPPVQAEAMYDPQIRATGERGELEVRVRP